jgi:predicted protein tyrosine phosphatase
MDNFATPNVALVAECRAYSPHIRDVTDFTALVLCTRSVKSVKSLALGLYLHLASKNPHTRSVKKLRTIKPYFMAMQYLVNIHDILSHTYSYIGAIHVVSF